MIKNIKEQIKLLELEIEEYEESFGENFEDFNPYDASGGNFDDAYYMGREHGETYGKLELLYELLRKIEEQSEMLSEAENLLSNAYSLLGNVHCYDTETYRDISRYFNGDEEEYYDEEDDE